MIYSILFAICGIGLITLGLSLFKLSDRVEAHAAELTEHHNKIDTLEINEGLFERIPDLEDKIKALEDTVEYLEGKL